MPEAVPHWWDDEFWDDLLREGQEAEPSKSISSNEPRLDRDPIHFVPHDAAIEQRRDRAIQALQPYSEKLDNNDGGVSSAFAGLASAAAAEAGNSLLDAMFLHNVPLPKLGQFEVPSILSNIDGKQNKGLKAQTSGVFDDRVPSEQPLPEHCAVAQELYGVKPYPKYDLTQLIHSKCFNNINARSSCFHKDFWYAPVLVDKAQKPRTRKKLPNNVSTAREAFPSPGSLSLRDCVKSIGEKNGYDYALFEFIEQSPALLSNVGMASRMIKFEASQAFHPGDKVEAFGLKSVVILNGKRGVVMIQQSNGMVDVDFGNQGDKRRLRPENLKKISSGGHGTPIKGPVEIDAGPFGADELLAPNTPIPGVLNSSVPLEGG